MVWNKSFVFRFDDVVVREREFLLVKAGEVLPVEPKAFRVLLILLRNPQKLITKEELLNAVWGDAAVTENSLTRSIALLRRLLGDEARDPRFIETVATVGYRFIGKVEASEDASGILEGTREPVVPANGESASTPMSGNTGDATTKRLPLDQSEEGRDKGGTLTGGKRKSLPGWLLPAAALLAAGLATVIWYMHRPLPPPRIAEYAQITHDGHNKWLGGTDGVRVYFNEVSPGSILQVGISGGGVARVPVAADQFNALLDVSPDGTRLVVAKISHERNGGGWELWSVPVLGGSLLRMGVAYDAAFSPDGNSIAYSTQEGDIWLVRSDGTGAHKLASPGGRPYGLAWSPDGNTIRFVDDRDLRLWEISSNGSNLHQFLPGWHSDGSPYHGKWTPDGRFFLFPAKHPPSNTVQIWALDERHGIFRRPPQEPIQLTTGPISWGRLVPGRDGKKIFSVGNTQRGELVRYDQRTREFKPFLGGISAEFVSFSRDGRYVAYVSFPDGILWKANRDGSNPVQLTDSSLYACVPRWSPDGTQILFMDFQDGIGTIRPSYIVSSGGGNPQRLMPDNSDDIGDPNWAPDGRMVVFAAEVKKDQRPYLGLLDLVSHKVTEIPGSTGMWSPRWSPDGRYIAAQADDPQSLRVFDMETRKWLGLPTKGLANFPQFSQDSKFIYFEQPFIDDPGLFRIRVTGGEEERLADLKDQHLTGLFGLSMALDPTDAPLVLRDIGSQDIYALTLEQK